MANANIVIADYEYDSSEQSHDNSLLVQLLKNRTQDLSILDKYEQK